MLQHKPKKGWLYVEFNYNFVTKINFIYMLVVCMVHILLSRLRMERVSLHIDLSLTKYDPVLNARMNGTPCKW
jgi:hypothetical protein